MSLFVRMGSKDPMTERVWILTSVLPTFTAVRPEGVSILMEVLAVRNDCLMKTYEKERSNSHHDPARIKFAISNFKGQRVIISDPSSSHFFR